MTVREGLAQGWAMAKRQPWLAIAAVMVSLTLVLVAGTGFRVWQLARNLNHETEDRIQLSCDMAYANGQALLDTVGADTDPELIERYRHNLERRANDAIHEFDPQFECDIDERPTD